MLLNKTANALAYHLVRIQTSRRNAEPFRFAMIHKREAGKNKSMLQPAADAKGTP